VGFVERDRASPPHAHQRPLDVQLVVLCRSTWMSCTNDGHRHRALWPAHVSPGRAFRLHQPRLRRARRNCLRSIAPAPPGRHCVSSSLLRSECPTHLSTSIRHVSPSQPRASTGAERT
jgi:hypothetical protein